MNIYKIFSTPSNICEDYKNTYGIALYEEKENGETVMLDSIEDITVEREELEAFVQQCNELELDPIHLHDVVEDCILTPR